MKIFLSIFVVFVTFYMLFFFNSTTYKKNFRKPAFYVWQRAWSSNVIEAVKLCDRELFVFASEFSLVNGKIKTENADVPAHIWQRGNVTPVFRIHTGLLNQNIIPKILSSISEIPLKSVQLDIDCPESQLPKYCQFLSEIRKSLPNYQISITALPCHLSNDASAELIAMTDFYVLQVHGLETPKTIHDHLGIMRRTIVERSIEQARGLEHPFQIALPTYAYRLHFDRETEQFSFLSAEINPSQNLVYSSRATDIDFKLLHDIFETNPDLPYIWFRLPVKGDLLNLDMKTVALLESGQIPEPKVSVRVEQVGNVVDLYLKSQSLISFDDVVVNLKWIQNCGEFDLYNKTKNISSHKVYAVLPTHLQAKIPSCGSEVKVASFYVDQLPECTVQ